MSKNEPKQTGCQEASIQGALCLMHTGAVLSCAVLSGVWLVDSFRQGGRLCEGGTSLGLVGHISRLGLKLPQLLAVRRLLGDRASVVHWLSQAVDRSA